MFSKAEYDAHTHTQKRKDKRKTKKIKHKGMENNLNVDGLGQLAKRNVLEVHHDNFQGMTESLPRIPCERVSFPHN